MEGFRLNNSSGDAQKVFSIQSRHICVCLWSALRWPTASSQPVSLDSALNEKLFHVHLFIFQWRLTTAMYPWGAWLLHQGLGDTSEVMFYWTLSWTFIMSCSSALWHFHQAFMICLSSRRSCLRKTILSIPYHTGSLFRPSVHPMSSIRFIGFK